MIRPSIKLIASPMFFSGGIIIRLAEGIKPTGKAFLTYQKAICPLQGTNKEWLEKHQVSESWSMEVPFNEIEKIFNRLKSATIPTLPEEASEPDGINYSLHINDGTNSITYEWRARIPQGWEVIEEIADRLLHLAGEKELNTEDNS